MPKRYKVTEEGANRLREGIDLFATTPTDKMPLFIIVTELEGDRVVVSPEHFQLLKTVLLRDWLKELPE